MTSLERLDERKKSNWLNITRYSYRATGYSIVIGMLCKLYEKNLRKKRVKNVSKECILFYYRSITFQWKKNWIININFIIFCWKFLNHISGPKKPHIITIQFVRINQFLSIKCKKITFLPTLYNHRTMQQNKAMISLILCPITYSWQISSCHKKVPIY